MRPVVDFLEQDEHSGWRYVTFGFGDQLALLSTLTTATTIDGSYHTARTLPELRTSGIGQIDTAFWFPDGLSKLDPILQKAGEHGVRWGFVNVAKYIPVLERNSWVKLKTLKGGVQVWENPNALPPSPSQPAPIDYLASFSWGTLPMLSLVTSLSLGSLRAWPLQAEKALRGVYVFVLGLLPLALSFWYYKTIYPFPHEKVYLIYTDALFFPYERTCIAGCYSLAGGKNQEWLLFLFSHSALSLFAFSLRQYPLVERLAHPYMLPFACMLFILSLREWPHALKFVLLGFCAALSIQFIIGVVEFANQTTAFLAPLKLNWPGPLDPSVRGAVVVQLASGESFLRAYGTLPHPNILGGFALIFLLAPIAFFLRKDNPNNLALLLLVPGVALLALTFSRSAWLALIVFNMVLIWKSKHFERKRLVVLLAFMVLSFVVTLFPYRELVQARTITTSSHAEEFSFIGRAWLNGEALNIIREVPLTGVGIGSFIIELGKRAGQGYVVEPAHNVLLLVGAELGIPGLLLVIALSILFAYRLFKTRDQKAILAGAMLFGLAVLSMFDHYLWTLAPGRLMLGLMIGLFVGQGMNHEA
jgi:O-antigen ligase